MLEISAGAMYDIVCMHVCVCMYVRMYAYVYSGRMWNLTELVNSHKPHVEIMYYSKQLDVARDFEGSQGQCFRRLNPGTILTGSDGSLALSILPATNSRQNVLCNMEGLADIYHLYARAYWLAGWLGWLFIDFHTF